MARFARARRFAAAIMLLSVVFLLVPGGRPVLSAGPFDPRIIAKPVIIETDMAADDWMMILFLLRRPEVDVKAIIVTGTGESHVKPGVYNALRLLTLAGHPYIPVAGGRETPLVGTHEFPADWRVAMDNLLDLTLPDPLGEPYDGTAVDLMAKVISTSEDPVGIVATGPISDVAEAIAAHPDLKDNIGMVYFMAGAVDVPGNLWPNVVNFDGEWNAYIDPVAMQQIFTSGLRVTLVPLDATNCAPVTQLFYDQLGGQLNTPESYFIYAVLTELSWPIRSGNLYFWDPLCAAIVVDPTLATFEDIRLGVVTQEGRTCGHTYRVFFRGGSVVRVAIAADGARFRSFFLETITD